MKKIKCSIKGVAPLLMHRYPEDADEPKAKKRTGRIDYTEQAENGAYRNEDDTLYIPSSNLEVAITRAAVNFRIPGRGRKTYKGLMMSSIIIDPEEIPINPQEYTVDKRSVRIQRSRVFRYRPRFNEWSLDFTIKILDEQIPVEDLRAILEYAGAAKGLGDYRPKFGRFEVACFEEVKRRHSRRGRAGRGRAGRGEAGQGEA